MITALARGLSSFAKLVACPLSEKVVSSVPALNNFSSATLAPEMVESPDVSDACCGRCRDVVWIGILLEPSPEEGVQCSGTNRFVGENVVAGSVEGLGDYCCCQWA